MFGSTYHLVGFCPQVVGAISGYWIVIVAGCKQDGGTHGEQLLLQEGLGWGRPRWQSTTKILWKNQMTGGGIFLMFSVCCVVQCNI